MDKSQQDLLDGSAACCVLVNWIDELTKDGKYSAAHLVDEATNCVIDHLRNKNSVPHNIEAKLEKYQSKKEEILNSINPENKEEAMQFIKKFHDRPIQKYPLVIDVERNATGVSYSLLLYEILDGDIEWVIIFEPYLKHLFQEFLEVILTSETNLKSVMIYYNLIQGIKDHDLNKQIERYPNVSLKLTKISELHDRKVVFSNGMQLSMGRGTEIYFDSTETDLSKKSCRDFTAVIFHRKDFNNLTQALEKLNLI